MSANLRDLRTYAEGTWCRGCGNFGILAAFKRAVSKLEERGIKRNNIIITAGIGCHGKIWDYLNLSGFYSLHGRAMSTAHGIKLGNPDLNVVTFAGDGDSIGEGIAHMIFSAKRNADITVITHDNGVYGLTTGQFTPRSDKGFRGPSTPRGNIEEPLNPLSLMLEAGATFVGRGYSGKLNELVDLFVEAIEHEGFAFVDVLQPCVSYNDTYAKYNELVEVLEGTPSTYEEAMAIAKRQDKLFVGKIYQTQRPVFYKQLYGDWNPALQSMPEKERKANIMKLLQG
ncbi:MAG: thiamine pyrophosphate-dependent enzyme [Candidatus Hermodarchaeota archaeon]